MKLLNQIFKKHFAASFIAILLCFSFFICCLNFERNNVAMASTEDTLSDSTHVEVMSYIDVFEEYYNMATEQLSAGDIEMPYTFEEFCDGYYMFDLDIQSYTDLLVAEAFGYINMSDYETSTVSSSDDEDYIIKGETSNRNSSNFDPDITPASAISRNINYGFFDFSAIQEGDILLETKTLLNDIGHTAMVYNIAKLATNKIVGQNTYIQTIEAVAGGVQFGFLDDDRMVDFGVVVLRATSSTQTKIENAKHFMWSQLGKSYGFPVTTERVNTSIDSTEWYCSELIYAAYLYAGLDLNAINSDGRVWPEDLANTSKTSYVCVSNCFDAKLVGKSNGKWRIRIYNNTNSSATLYYNTKLAFESDAKKWTSSLKNVTSVTIMANGYTTVSISTNVFATTAAFSKVVDGVRYVTYCNGLNSETLRMRVMKNII